jgi:hypothetical protein
MRRIDVLQVTFLALLGLLFGLFATSCEPEGVVPDDDDVTPPATDDDDDDDDDDASGPPSMSFDPSDVNAGAVVAVTAAIENFDLVEGAAICCASDEVVLIDFEAPAPDTYLLTFFFGLRSEGTHSWGIDNGAGVEVEDDFEVTALPGFDEVSLGAHTADGTVAAGGFAVAHFEVTEPNQFVIAQASALSPDAFHPWIWLIADDGYTGLSAVGFANPDAPGGYDAPIASFFAAEPASYFVRVEDNSFGAGTFSLDLGTVPADSIEIPEVEPNDETAQWQDLGTLDGGIYTLTGEGETAGHDGDTNDLNGDLDVFRFQLAHDTVVSFAMSFDAGEDFDAVIYDDSGGDTELGFGSAQAVSLDMATTANPEGISLLLEAGTPYVIGIGNWDGTDGAEWSMTLTVPPGSFPDDGGDDDDSAGDDDDDDDSGGDDDDDDDSGGDDDDDDDSGGDDDDDSGGDDDDSGGDDDDSGL